MHHSVCAPSRQLLSALLVVASLVTGLASVSADHEPDGSSNGLGSVSSPAEAAELGWIWVPTAGPDRLFQPVTGHGVTLWYIDTISPGAPFALQPQRQGVGVCSLGQCVQTLDFDVVFYAKESGGLTKVVARYDTLGDESGTVPSDAAFAYIFLRTPGLIPDFGQGYGFAYRQGDAGSDRLPTIG